MAGLQQRLCASARLQVSLPGLSCLGLLQCLIILFNADDTKHFTRRNRRPTYALAAGRHSVDLMRSTYVASSYFSYSVLPTLRRHLPFCRIRESRVLTHSFPSFISSPRSPALASVVHQIVRVHQTIAAASCGSVTLSDTPRQLNNNSPDHPGSSNKTGRRHQKSKT